MDYIFAAQEIWTLTNESSLISSLTAAATAYQVIPFSGLGLIKERMADPRNLKPSLIIIDLDALPSSTVQKDLLESGIFASSSPVAVCGSKERAGLIRGLLEYGVACFMFKPFPPEEMALRLEHALRTPLSHVQYMLNFLRSFGAELTSTELKILLCFLENKSRSITRTHIMESLWGHTVVHPKTLDVHLFNLRKKLASIGCQIISGRGGSWTLQKAQ